MISISLTGNLGSDAEVRHLPSGDAEEEISVAVSVGYGDRKQTDWYRCQLWGKRAEGGIIQYLKKGTQVAITGQLKMNKWTNNEGVEKTTPDVSIDQIDLIGGAQQQPTQQQPAQKQASGGEQIPPPVSPVEADIPFMSPYRRREYLV